MNLTTLQRSYTLSRREEHANAWTHGIMAVLLLLTAPLAVGYVVTATGKNSLIDGLGVAIFILCLIMMFTASTVYHGLPARSRLKPIWNRIDHMAIYFAIAGSYTPIALSVIGSKIGWLILALEWTLVIGGLLFKAFYFKKNRLSWVISIALYLMMGWVVVLCMPVMIARAQTANLWLIIAGGLFYTGGLIFFAQTWRYAHLVWHGFVIAGALSHFIAIIFFLG